MSLVASIARRTDSWVNALTGLGTLRDKLMHAQIVPGVKLSVGELESLYNDDDLAKRIVNKVPREATRRGYRLELEGTTDEDSAEVTREVNDAMNLLEAVPKLREAWIWGRLYSAGAVFVGANDGQQPDQPLDEKRIRSIDFLNVLKRPQLTIRKRWDDITKPEYGRPELYEVNQTQTLGGALQPSGVLIHASRLIMFNGALTARTHGESLEGWDDSVLQDVVAALRQAQTAWQSVAHLIADASQGVLKVANLVDLIAADGQEALRTRITMMDLARSVCRSILIDADRESFERVSTSFAGLPEMMDRMMMRVAAAAEMPVTILFGRSPAGLNATGESDIRGWYDVVADAQNDVLKPRLERLLRLVMSSLDGATRGKVPERWTVEFNPLWQPTELEQATVLKMKADTHVALVTAEIEMQAEAGLALAADFPAIDAKHRRELLEADLAEGLRPGEDTAGDDPAGDDDDGGGSKGDGPKADSLRTDAPHGELDQAAHLDGQARDARGRWAATGSTAAGKAAKTKPAAKGAASEDELVDAALKAYRKKVAARTAKLTPSAKAKATAERVRVKKAVEAARAEPPPIPLPRKAADTVPLSSAKPGGAIAPVARAEIDKIKPHAEAMLAAKLHAPDRHSEDFKKLSPDEKRRVFVEAYASEPSSRAMVAAGGSKEHADRAQRFASDYISGPSGNTAHGARLKHTADVAYSDLQVKGSWAQQHYAATQALIEHQLPRLKSAGKVDADGFVTLYRGVGGEQGQNIIAKQKYGDKVHLGVNKLSSWSDDPNISRKFGGVIVKTKVHYSRAFFSHHAASRSHTDEGEWVLLHDDGQAHGTWGAL